MSDKKIQVEDNGRVVSYEPELRSVSDYAPFGMQMVGRKWQAGGYRYGFNGKEKSDEVYGEGNVYDYGFRIYNPRIGKFLSVDPLQRQYPELTPYQFSSNSPIQGVDLDGREIYHYLLAIDKGGVPKLTYLGEQTRRSGWWEIFDYRTDNWKDFNGEKIKGTQIYVHSGSVTSDAPKHTFNYFKEFIEWIQAGYPARQPNDNTAAEISRNAVTTLTYMDLSQKIDQADGDDDGYVNPNNYGKKNSPKSKTDQKADEAHGGNDNASTASAKSSTNRGVGTALETASTNDMAQAYEDRVIGASSDVLTRKRIVPTLKYDNPNSKGKNFVKFDGFDVENNTLVDRKWNVTTFPKALNQLQRMSEALKQNPGYSGVIEVPNQAVYNTAIKAINKANVSNITVRVAQ